MARRQTERLITQNASGVSTDRYATRTDGEIDAGWGDKILKVRGIMPMLVVLLGASLYFSANLMMREAEAPVKAIAAHVAGTDSQHLSLSNVIQDHRLMNERDHQALIKTQERIADSLDQQVFYLSKTEKERAHYQIELPDSLRKKLVERTHNREP